MTGRFFLLTGFLAIALITAFCGKSLVHKAPAVYEVSGETMGTTFEIRLIPSKPLSDTSKMELKEGIRTLLEDINTEVNHYDKSSQISRYNQAEEGATIQVGYHFTEILSFSEQANRLTLGGFNVEIGSLVKLWGFGPDSARRDTPPPADEIRSQLPDLKRGYLLTDGQKLKKVNRHSTLDFSGVAKGYAVDRIGLYLRSLSIKDYLVNIGGELTASGNAADGKPGWKVAILSPDSGSEMLAHIRLQNESIATSGIYFNQFSEGKKIYSHLISPEDGSADHDVVSISIVSEKCALADALATGLAVLHPEQLQSLLEEKQSLYNYLIVTKSGKYLRSEDFPKSI